MTVARWSWLGDQLALDAANTVRRRGWRYIELITTPDDLTTWLFNERHRVTVPHLVDAGLVARFLVTRDHLLHVLRAAAGHSPWPQADVSAINSLALGAPVVRLLGAGPGQHRCHRAGPASDAARLEADLATAAIDLLTGPDARDLALCDAPGCGQLYRRGRPNQQWCDPHCGTRARSQRHAERAGTPG